MKFLIYLGKLKGSKTVIRLTLSEKIDSPRKLNTNFPLVTLKCCCLPGILGKHTKFITFFVHPIDKIPIIFWNLEPGAQQSKLNMFFHSERQKWNKVKSKECQSRAGVVTGKMIQLLTKSRKQYHPTLNYPQIPDCLSSTPGAQFRFPFVWWRNLVEAHCLWCWILSSRFTCETHTEADQLPPFTTFTPMHWSQEVNTLKQLEKVHVKSSAGRLFKNLIKLSEYLTSSKALQEEYETQQAYVQSQVLTKHSEAAENFKEWRNYWRPEMIV